MNFYDFSIRQLNGEAFDLSQLKGKKVVLVNVASECGLTPQYTELEALYTDYKGRDVVFIGVPCNDFGGQEPGAPGEIQEFCSVNYGVTFPLTEKIHTTGPEIHPLYRWLTEQTGETVTWNFQKFLINGEGKVEQSVAPAVSPSDPLITEWLNNGN